jgi:alkylation response protein AidB-like acyl-CoA dehydrogenase
MLREQARKFLAGRCSRQVVRKVFEGGAGYDAELWAEIARMGWLGTAVPEPYGGSGVGYDGLCLLAEELGYVLAPVPFSSSIYLAAEAIMIAGSEAQKQKLLPPMIDGSRIGTVALAEGMGNPSPEHIKAKVASGHLTGTKMPVPDGEIAHFAVVAARDEADDIGVYVVELSGKGVARTRLKGIDPARNQAKIVFDGAPAERLEGARGYAIIDELIDRAAILNGVRAGRRRASVPRHGEGLCRGSLRIRAPDRRVPGHQTQARRRLCCDRVGKIERLLRRLGHHGRRRGAAGRRRRRPRRCN